MKRTPPAKPAKSKPAPKKSPQPGDKRVPARDGLAKYARSIKAMG
jgi:hypothetical protein